MGLSGAYVSRVSVVVPTCNRDDLLEEALASIQRLEGPDLRFEIIIADNASSNATAEIARRHGAVYQPVMRQGAAAARNAGMRVATSEYLAFLDDDDVWLLDHLRPHIGFLDKHADFDAVVGQVINTDLCLTSNGIAWPKDLPTHGDLFPSFLEYMPQIGSTVVRTSVRETVGWFDESLMGDEDWDWHLRLALRHRIGFVDVPCVLFRQRPPGARDELQQKRLPYMGKVLWRNARLAPWSRAPRGKIARVYLRHVGSYTNYFLDSFTVHARAGKRVAAFRSLIWAVRASPLHAMWALARRRELWWTLAGAALSASE